MSDIQPLQDAVDQLQDGQTLSATLISDAFRVIMGGRADDDLLRTFLTALATRVPTGEELYGATVVMKECVKSVALPQPETLLDTCGTGGAPKTFNVSTAAGVVAAACGVRVAKHGNRSRTGRGSAEVLEAVGINIHNSCSEQIECLNKVGICFSFAPNHHKAVAHVMPVRKSLNFPTIFNLIGPLTNPCSAGCQLLGVWDKKYLQPMAEALQSGGVIRGAVVHSEDGLDEISISAPTTILFVTQQTLREELINPLEFGLRVWNRECVTASSLEDAVLMMMNIFEGKAGGPRDMVVLNTGVALLLSGICDSIQEGVHLAKMAIDDGKCSALIKDWKHISNNTPSTSS